MATTFIIEEQDKIIFEDKIGCTAILYPSDENLLEDHQLHDWIVKVFKTFDPSSLVIPLLVRNDRFKGLVLGLHIRLNHELTYKQKTIPLFFISEEFDYTSIFSDTTLEIKNNRALPHYLLTTPNCFLEEPNLEVVKKAIDVCKPMTPNDYRHKFLDVIKINASETTGKHSIANIWGAFQLARTTGHINILTEDRKLLRSQKDLFFKYIRAQSSALEYGLNKEENASDRENQSEEDQSSSEVLTIEASEKNILFIDDEANKGWDIVLSGLFKEANFEVVDRNSKEEFNSFYNRASSKALEINEEGIPKWDLILLDLRLNEIEDIGDNVSKKAEDFSGAELLLKIKSANKGTQVIMFTASNKAWNMRDLMDSSMGANGFYIKEAPEYNQDPSFSKRNFESLQSQIYECFERKPLRRVYLLNQSIQKRLALENGVFQNQILSRSKANLIGAYLKQAFSSLSHYSSSRKEFALFSFLDYYKIIETLGNELVIKDRDNKIVIKAGIRKTDFIFLKPKLLSKIEPIKDNGIIAGFLLKDYLPPSDDEKFYKKPSSSTKFSGLMLLKFGCTEADVQNFISLNSLRNKVVAHSSDKVDDEIHIDNVVDLVQLICSAFKKI